MITNLKLLANSLKSYMSTTSQKPDQIICVITHNPYCTKTTLVPYNEVKRPCL